jgi:translocation and assembly module TamA
VPADLRFYAGGGGSVRGFGFQLAGELDDDDNPLGGRSLVELSGEVRVRLTETIGAVAFVDAGSAFGSSVPDFNETLRIGAGPGLRYFSPLGPVRLDIGFPINARDTDDSFQLYISLGQAF